MHFHFPGMVGLLSSGEFFNSAESFPAAFTCFFLQASNSQPRAEESPATLQHKPAAHKVTYTQHLNSHLETGMLHGCTRQAAARIPREDPSLYIESC